MESRKRRKVEMDSTSQGDAQISLNNTSTPHLTDRLNMLDTRRSISPPTRRKQHTLHSMADPPPGKTLPISSSPQHTVSSAARTPIPSPVQLVSVKDLPSTVNINTISLHDILGDPLIKESWIFNFLFDVDFIMSQFDEDTRDLVQVKLIHGSWKKDDSNRIHIDEATKRYPNVQAKTAYMPEAYGTHHSKMIINFRHDDQAQVVILTANMVAGDWRMCQAVWRSPLLPLSASDNPEQAHSDLPLLGSGARFKHDFLAYLRKYETRAKDLVALVSKYDFSSIRAALIASTPGKQHLPSLDHTTENFWGWPALKRVLDSVPVASSEPHIVIQISSVASIGEKWIAKTFFDALSSHAPLKNARKQTPKFSIIFPTPDEIQRSIDGYSSGGSIHMKTQSAAQQKQLKYLAPMLCHWAGDAEPQPQYASSSTTIPPPPPIRQAGRRRAAPHIKTYIRFTDSAMTSIDWAMMTSANLSTQAWGASPSVSSDVRICSYEIGIVVWPALWDDTDVPGTAQMVPVFKTDLPTTTDPSSGSATTITMPTRVGWRMPYDLPLVPYAEEDKPWCATEACSDPDWMGRVWPGFGSG